MEWSIKDKDIPKIVEYYEAKIPGWSSRVTSPNMLELKMLQLLVENREKVEELNGGVSIVRLCKFWEDRNGR